MEETIKFITNLGPNAALMFAIMALLAALKKSPIATWTFPFIAMICGAVGFVFVGETTDVPHDIKSVTAYKVVVGAVIGYAAVGLHQNFKKLLGAVGKSENGGTKFIKKDEVKP